MNRLHFLLVSFFSAVGAALGFRGKAAGSPERLRRDDFTVEITRVDDFLGTGQTRIVGQVIDTRNGTFVRYASPSLEFCSEGIARMDIKQWAEDSIDDRMRNLDDEWESRI